MRLAPLLLLAILAACGKSPPAVADLDSLDRDLVGNAADPALAIALRQPIMVDPGLAQSSNARAVRPAPSIDTGAMPPDDLGRPADTSKPGDLRPTPVATPGCPGCRASRGALTLGALAERQAGRGPGRGIAACAPAIRYASAWADRLPPALPLYPDALVAEAAGTDANGCRLRAVTFSSAAAPSRVGDWFGTHAVRGGFAVEHRADGAEHMLSGTRGAGNFVLFLRPRGGGGTEADLVSNVGE